MGKYTWADGRVYEGHFLHGRQDGFGKYTSKTGAFVRFGHWGYGHRKGKWIDENDINYMNKIKEISSTGLKNAQEQNSLKKQGTLGGSKQKKAGLMLSIKSQQKRYRGNYQCDLVPFDKINLDLYYILIYLKDLRHKIK